jgi:copper chaperone CopZ
MSSTPQHQHRSEPSSNQPVAPAPAHGDVGADQLAVIKIEGMHCHKCETSIRNALMKQPGVHEVEVDFASGQASVLFRRDAVSVKALMQSVNDAGYHATGVNTRQHI